MERAAAIKPASSPPNRDGSTAPPTRHASAGRSCRQRRRVQPVRLQSPHPSGTPPALAAFGPSAGSPRPTMPSADFCVVFSGSHPPPSMAQQPPCTAQISRGNARILPRIGAGFTKCTHPGIAPGFADGGLGGHVPTGPGCITPHIRFLFIAPRFRLELPPHPASRRRTCPLTNLRLC